MAKNEWIGNALAVKQVTTITIANTWATADTVTVTINGKALVVTVGTAATTDDVAAALFAALSGAALVDDESRTGLGTEIPEFTEFVASVVGSVVTLTGDTEGVPFTVSASEVTAGTGTATGATPTAAAGPNDVANVKNWSLLALPATGDDIVISRPISMLYGLTALAAVTPGTLSIYSSFWSGGANIGLQRINGAGTNAYNEYRPLALQFLGCDAGEIGIGEASGEALMNIDFITGDVTLTVSRTGDPKDKSRPALCLALNPSAVADGVLEVISGSVGVGFYGETCKATTRIGYRDNQNSDAKVIFGTGVTHGATSVIAGGNVEINSNTTSIAQGGGVLTLNAGAHPTVKQYAGTLNYNSTGALGGTASTVVGAKAILDFSRDMSVKTVSSTILLSAGATLNDPNGVVASLVYQPVNCRSSDVTVNGPFNKVHTLS